MAVAQTGLPAVDSMENMIGCFIEAQGVDSNSGTPVRFLPILFG
jgi:hypothetical protein